MARYTAGQLQSLWLSAGGSSGSVRISTGESLPLPVVMAAIALAESSGNASAVNPGYGAGGQRTREYSVGLWQINTLVHKVYTREQLLDRVWGGAEYIDPGTVTVHIRRVREKIEADPSKPVRLVTVWGVGYKFEP